MKRRLFTIISAVSLLVFVAVVVLWVRSYWVGDAALVRWRRPAFDSPWVGCYFRDVTIISGRGVLALHTDYGWVSLETWNSLDKLDLWSSRDADAPPWHPSLRQRNVTPLVGFAAFKIVGHTFVAVPHWFIALLLVVQPVRRLVANLRRGWAAARAGLCPSCGYDLRATSGRCPECGREPVATPVPPK